MGRSQFTDPVTVYIGPTIRSAIQRNAIFMGTREEAKRKLARAIEKYPPIASLLIPSEELAEARKMIIQPGNLLYENNRHLIGLLKTNGG